MGLILFVLVSAGLLCVLFWLVSTFLFPSMMGYVSLPSEIHRLELCNIPKVLIETKKRKDLQPLIDKCAQENKYFSLCKLDPYYIPKEDRQILLKSCKVKLGLEPSSEIKLDENTSTEDIDKNNDIIEKCFNNNNTLLEKYKGLSEAKKEEIFSLCIAKYNKEDDFELLKKNI